MVEATPPKEAVDHFEGEGDVDIKNVPAPEPMPDPEAERRLVRKLDRTILPWIMLLYLLSYIDRCVGNQPPLFHRKRVN